MVLDILTKRRAVRLNMVVAIFLATASIIGVAEGAGGGLAMFVAALAAMSTEVSRRATLPWNRTTPVAVAARQPT